ncbi:cellulose binding domain-containing protein [Dactylosporangium aurantiacum]|uniref:Cellulose binding domain-containing protein n=1 Tax=Dactylosporangium aurantiacum TaxID=35754 RepID=A0A9Q9IRU6_9ACTN|nr:cellulose binding domain-containing protein [Dactylosporangium aurantiacum]MDG6107626.1 cellulose binding domain-containing protein [Dactylosporangium aurantiacum]UWZ58775.1 cellulose binding domain-containing protein [Dactylosporangium aurantiacum]
MSESNDQGRRSGPRTRVRVAAVAAMVLTAGVAAVGLTTNASAASGCQVAYTTTTWSGGFTANISVTNLGSPLTSWTLGFTLPGGEAVGQGWSATFNQSGQQVTAASVDYNGALGTNASTGIGFNGTFSGSAYPGDPTSFTLNGVACTGKVTATPSATPSASPSRTASPSPSVSPGPAGGAVVQNDVFWKDTSGNPIYSQGGGVLKVGNTYYWYGAKYNGAVTYYNNPGAGKNGDTSFNAITAYSSTDLAHWKFEGNVLTAADLGGAGWVGRIGVARNPNTGKYVLISQLNSGLVFATSSTPNGHFTKAATQATIGNVVNDMTGDQSVFVDDDGQAYLAFSNVRGRSHLYVARLRPSDYLQVEPAANIFNSSAGGREGNVMFKHAGTYYFCSSDLHGWNASHTYCITSSKVSSGYSSEFVMQGTDADFSHVTQTGLAFAVNGSAGSFVMFGGDRWSDFAGNGIGYNQWVPVSFNGKTPIFNSLSQWNVDAAAGTWSVGRGNNYVLNPSVEADRVSQSTMAGWTGSANVANHSGGHTGRWSMAQSASSAYTANVYQNISVPNGTYTLSAWVKSSGGQKSANLYAKNYGGGQLNRSISQSISNWTQVSITGITVSNGSIQVGVSSDANAGNWIYADDFSLVRTS